MRFINFNLYFSKMIIFLRKAITFFILQTIFEGIIIIIFMYVGIPYNNTLPSNEFCYEIVIGVLMTHCVAKILLYGWLYVILFFFFNQLFIKIIITEYRRLGIINIILSISLPLFLLYIHNLYFLKILNMFLSALITSFVIFMYKEIMPTRHKK